MLDCSVMVSPSSTSNSEVGRSSSKKKKASGRVKRERKSKEHKEHKEDNDDLKDQLQQAMEATNIGYRLGEECLNLREEVACLKQEKRILLVTKETLEDEFNKTARENDALKTYVAKLRASTERGHHKVERQRDDYSQLKDRYNRLSQSYDKKNALAKLLQKQLSHENAKCKIISDELEKSLRDEIAVRMYLQTTEQRLNSTIPTIQALQLANDTRIAQSALICQELHCLAEDFSNGFANKHAWEAAADIGGIGGIGGNMVPPSTEKRFSIGAVTLADEPSIRQHTKEMLDNIRKGFTHANRKYSKSRAYIQQLLDVIKSYEEWLPGGSGGSDQEMNGAASK